MFRQLENLINQHRQAICRAGWVFVGGLYTYVYMDIRLNKMKEAWVAEMVKMKKQWIEEVNVRSDLLNWMVEEGIYMDGEDFFPQYQEKAKFVNVITEHTT